MLSDPIVALATVPGRSALALVRLSGRGAFEIAARVVRGFDPGVPRRAVLATFVDAAGEAIDRGIWTAYAAPASHTGEDVVELACHGGLLAPARVIAALQAAGARAAAPGEFTRRAVLNGKLDLIQAEAVGDLIDATAPAQARAALHQLDGALSRRIDALREQLIEIESLLSYDIDFPEEDDGPVPRERIAAQAAAAAAAVRRLLASAPAGERLRDGATVVLAGRPNTGKSSLFNALLGFERAIVTEIAGTTRDAVEAATSFGGWPVRLVDTAGLRDAQDRVERIGVEVSRRWLDAADLVLLCIEADREPDDEERQWAEQRPTLVVRTKADLAAVPPDGCAVSTVSGQGLDEVAREIAELAPGGAAPPDLEPMITRERHRTALAAAAGSLDEATGQLAPGGDPVLASHHVREAASALEELIGTVDVENVLDRLFSSFCVGK
jgi:tRNA modification GTPase